MRRGDSRSQAAIAAGLGLSRNTVPRLARAAAPRRLLVFDYLPGTASILHDYEVYLRERWNSGCTNAIMPWREIRARPYPGVRDHLARFPRKRPQARPGPGTAAACGMMPQASAYVTRSGPVRT
jgi:hypothetical protein